MQVATLEGSLPAAAAGTWIVGLAISLKLTEPTKLSAAFSLKDPIAAACARLHLIDEDTYEARTWDGLCSGAVELEPNASGYTLLLDYKHTADLDSSDWSLELTSTAEVTRASPRLLFRCPASFVAAPPPSSLPSRPSH